MTRALHAAICGGLLATIAVAVVAQDGRTADTIRQALHAGRYEEALSSLRPLLDRPRPPDAASSPVTAAEAALLAALLTGAWTPVADLVPEQLSPRDAEAYWYLRGIQAARAAWPGGREDALAMARESAERLVPLASLAGAWSRAELRRVSVLAAIAGAQEERDELTLLLAHGDQLQARLLEIRPGEDVVLPFDELAGDLWLQIHRFDDARQRYARVVQQSPGRTRAWLGLARAARDAGAGVEARAAAREVQRLWADTAVLERVASELRQIIEGSVAGPGEDP